MLGAAPMPSAGGGGPPGAPRSCAIPSCPAHARPRVLAGKGDQRNTEPCSSPRGHWDVKAHRTRQALEELSAQRWPWEGTYTPGHVASVP